MNNNSMYKLNKFLCLMFCIWFAWPYLNYWLGMYYGVIISILWIATSGRFIFLKKWSLDLILTLIFFITLLPYVITGEFKYSTFNTISILGTFYLFLIGMYMFQYYINYRKDYMFLGKIATFTVAFFVIGSIQTFIGLSMYPQASRYLAVGGLDQATRELFSSMGIGGFNFIYSAVFLLLIVFHTLVNQKDKLPFMAFIFLSLSILVIGAMIIKSSYAIAVLMLILGVVLVLTVRSKRTFYILLALSIVFLLVFPLNLSGRMLLDIVNLFPNNTILKEKLFDLAQTIINIKDYHSQTMARLELYALSLKTFLKQPIFGINGPFGNKNDSIGGHSGWFDIMAYFGLFVTIPLFASIMDNFRKILKLFKNHESKTGFYIIQFFFIVYGIINPILYIYEIGLVVFLIVPSLPYISFYLKSKSRLTQKKEEKNGRKGLIEDIMVN